MTAADTLSRLDAVLGALDPLISRLVDAGLAAGPLAAETDWHSAAARAFHAEADAWAGSVRGLHPAAEDLRDATRRARDALAIAAWP